MSKPYRVHVVVDTDYGERIRDLPIGEPAWVVDSPINHPIIASIWKDRPGFHHLAVITSFKYNAEARPEERLICEMPTIDLHHGEDSHDPPYTILNVIGVEWSQEIREELGKFGFHNHEVTPQGFVVRRKPN